MFNPKHQQLNIRNIIIILGIVLFIQINIFNGSSSNIITIEEEDGGIVKIMGFNILNGGQGDDRDDKWIDPIVEQNADIIVINEAAYWEANDFVLLNHYVDMINSYHWPDENNYTGMVTTSGGSPAIAILSRYSFLNFNTLLLGNNNRVFAHASFKVFDERIEVYGVHLKSGATQFDRDDRKSQIDALMNEVKIIPSSNTVFVMGDFNSYSPVDIADPTIYPNWDYDPTWTVEQAGTYPMETALANGFIDTFRKTNPTEPGWSCFDTHPDADYSAFGRIDYQLVSENKADDLILTERIYDPVRSPTWSDHAPFVGSYWFGEQPVTTTTITTTTGDLTSKSSTDTTDVSTSFSSIYLVLGSIVPLILMKKKKRD